MEHGRRTSWEGNWKVEITDSKMAVDMDKKKYVVGNTPSTFDFSLSSGIIEEKGVKSCH